MSAAAAMMGKSTPTFVSQSGNGGNLAPSLAINTPSGFASGDLIVVFYGAQGAVVTWAPPGGYSEKLDQGASPSLGVSVEVDTGAGLETWISSSSVPTNLAGYKLRFRLAAYDTIGSVGTVTGNGTLTMPAITSAGGLVVALIMAEDGFGAAATTPTGFTSIVNSTSNGQMVNISYKLFPPGSTGSVASTISGATNVTGGVLVGLK